ncbi:MAG: glycoside hydrolase family 5 protein [Kiritimatiellia bacterium]
MKYALFSLAVALACSAPAAGAAEWKPSVRWRGFNLLGMFIKGSQAKPDFREEDFQIMRDWGFNFARLPMDYRYWIRNGNWDEIDEDAVKPVDQAVAWGRKYGIHTQICLHRIPGYTVARPAEPRDLFTDAEAQRVACRHWAFFARRYKGVPNEALSFNLFNEPPTVADEVYGQVAKKLIAAIRAEDPARYIVADGISWGRQPCRSLFGIPGVGQATRGYTPMGVSHYRASWAGNPTAEPVWPMAVDAPTGHCYGQGKAPWNVPFEFDDMPAGRLVFRLGRVSGDVAFRISADGETLKDVVLKQPEGPGWTNVVYNEEWKIYQSDYAAPVEVELARPARKVKLEMLRGDWFVVNSLEVADASGRKARLAFENAWGKPRSHHLRFVGWQGRASFKAVGGGVKPRYADPGMEYLYRTLLAPWDDAVAQGVFCMTGEFGAYRHTPHDLVLDWLEDYLRLWQERGMGWAMWNLRGPFGVLDSDRADVQYEDFRGHRLDRKMLDLLLQY